MSYQVPEDKPSWYSTEFIFTVVTSLISLAVLMGWVPQTDVDTLNGLIHNTVELVGALILNGTAIWGYIKSRTTVKVEKMALRREELRMQLREHLTEK